MIRAEPSQERLRALFRYNEKTGNLIWARRPESDFPRSAVANSWNAKNAGRVAGSAHRVNGYVYVTIDGNLYMAHRLIWVLLNGPIEQGMVIDHADGDKPNNRAGNLAKVTQRQNMRNKKSMANNSSGHVGVRWSAQHKRWRAYGTCDGRFKHLGLFESLATAAKCASDFRAANDYSLRHGK